MFLETLPNLEQMPFLSHAQQFSNYLSEITRLFPFKDQENPELKHLKQKKRSIHKHNETTSNLILKQVL